MSIANKCINGVCVCVLPRQENNHRPLALRHGPLAFMSAVLIMLKIMAVATVALTPTQAELSTITSNRIVQLTNNERVKNGRVALNVSPALTKAAQEKGQHMINEDYFAHISPSGVTPWFWINKAGYSYTIAGENLAIDFTEAEDVVAGWLGSPSHKENMLQPDYTETGVAVVTGEFQGGTSTIVVHMFGKPVSYVPPPETAPAPASPAPPTVASSESATPPTSPASAPKSAPTPVPLPAPNTPTVTLKSKSQTRHDVMLNISGDPGSTVQIVINSEKKDTLTIPESGSTTHTQDISDLADGLLKIKTYAFNAQNVQSSFSEDIEVIKHTTGPNIAKEDIVMVLAPGTDRPQLAMRVMSNSYSSLQLPDKDPLVAADQDFSWLSLIQNTPDPITIVFTDDIGNDTQIRLSATPSFSTDNETVNLREPAKFTSMTRNISLVILMSIVILLTLSIAIRINIQHPGLIFHSIFVILLAGLMILF